MKNIAVIGSGTMGNGIAHIFAQHGFSVTLIDISEDALKKAEATIEKNLGRHKFNSSQQRIKLGDKNYEIHE